jgi:hypothetical protein
MSRDKAGKRRVESEGAHSRDDRVIVRHVLPLKSVLHCKERVAGVGGKGGGGEG